MFTTINSLSLPSFILLNGVLMFGCIYSIIKEKDRKKLYIPILYLLLIGVVISVINKCVLNISGLAMYSCVVEYIYYGYIGIFFVSLITISLIGINRKNDPNINKPMIYVGVSLLAFCTVGFLMIKLITQGV